MTRLRVAVLVLLALLVLAEISYAKSEIREPETTRDTYTRDPVRVP